MRNVVEHTGSARCTKTNDRFFRLFLQCNLIPIERILLELDDKGSVDEIVGRVGWWSRRGVQLGVIDPGLVERAEVWELAN